MGDITHLNVAGWNGVYVGAFFFSLVFVLVAHRHIAEEGKRILFGAGYLSVGLIIRIGTWNPWRSFLYWGEPDLAEAYKSYSEYWTLIGALFMLYGLHKIAEPALKKRFGILSLPAVGVFGVLMFVSSHASAYYFFPVYKYFTGG